MSRRPVLGAAMTMAGIMLLFNIRSILHAVPDITYMKVGGLASTLPSTVGFVVFYLGILLAYCGYSLSRNGTFFPPEVIGQ